MAKKLTIFQRLNKLLGVNGFDKEYVFNPDKLKNLKPDEFAVKKIEIEQSLYLQNQWRKIDNELYQKAVYYEPTRMASYYDYEAMEYSLHGDTKITTTDGIITIKELAEKGRSNEFFVYAYDHNNNSVVTALARNAHFTRKELCHKITFDDGNFVIGTYGHRFLNKDAVFVKLENLNIGDGLMSFDINHKGDITYPSYIGEANNPNAEVFTDTLNKVVSALIKGVAVSDLSDLLAIDNNLIEKSFGYYGYKSWLDVFEYHKIPLDNYYASEEYFSNFVPWDVLVDLAMHTTSLDKVSYLLDLEEIKVLDIIKNGGYSNWELFLSAYGVIKSDNIEDQNIKYRTIVSIEEFGVHPVYDLTVPGYKNFATDCIFSHNTPEISVALDIFSDEATTENEKGNILNIYSDSARIKDELTDLFENVLDINTNLPAWGRNLCKYGDNFVYNKIIPGKGIVGVVQLPNVEITRTEPGFTPAVNDDENEVQFHWVDKNISFNSFEMSHFRLISDDRKLPYGTSLLEKVRRIWKQLLLAEDAMLVYRVTRAPERRVYKVYVGNMDDKDVDAYVDKIANNIKRVSMSNPNNGNQDTRYNPLAVDQDYFIPVRDPSAAMPIETLPGACISLDTEIPLIDGRVLPLYEIIELWNNGVRDLWVYSCHPNTGAIEPGLITWAGITRENAEVIEFTLDNGEKVITTPDHKWVHRTDSFVEAENLKVGDSIMPFNSRKITSDNSEDFYYEIWDNESQSWKNDFGEINPLFEETNKSDYYNHKIIGIKHLSEKYTTGTITVDGDEIYHNYHTFAIKAGVFIKNSNLSEIADIEYIQNKMLAALRVPKEFLGFAEKISDGGNLAVLDIRFARAVHRVQKALVQELNKMAIIHLYTKGYEDDLTNFTLSLNSPSTQVDSLRLENWTSKINLYKEAVSDAGNGFAAMSMTMAKKQILGQSDDEIKLDVQRQLIEKSGSEEMKALSETIKQTGIFRDIYKLYSIDPNNMSINQGEDDSAEGFDSIGGGGGGGGAFGGVGTDFTSGGDLGGEIVDAGDTGGTEGDVDIDAALAGTEGTTEDTPEEPTEEEPLAENTKKYLKKSKVITDNFKRTIKNIDKL
jgi:intein/homing endonuclease